MTGHAVVWCSTKELSENFKHTFELWHKNLSYPSGKKIQQRKSEQSHQKYNIHMLFLLSMGWQKFCLQLALEKIFSKWKIYICMLTSFANFERLIPINIISHLASFLALLVFLYFLLKRKSIFQIWSGLQSWGTSPTINLRN